MKQTVTILDQDREFTERVYRQFSSLGYQVNSFNDSTSFVDKFIETEVDLLCISWKDYIGLDSDFSTKLWNKLNLTNTPVLLLIAENNAEKIVSALNCGFNDFFCKTNSLDSFILRVKQMISFFGRFESNAIRDLRKSILVVSSFNERSAIIKNLPDEDFKVSQVNRLEAFSLIKRNNFNLILIDDTVSEFDSIQLIKEIRSDNLFCCVPIIIQQEKSSYIARMLESGAEDFIEANTDPRIFKFKLDQILTQQGICNGYTTKLEQNKKRFEEEIRERNNKLKITNRFLLNDLKMAAEFQQSVLPDISKPRFIDIEVCYLPMEIVSGDIYEISFNREGEINIFLGDATGHGVSAAFLTMMLQIALDSIRPDLPPSEILHQLNLLMALRGTGKYITGVQVRVTPEGKLIVAHAGHPSILIIPKNSEKLVEFYEGGCPLAMFHEEPVPYENERYQLEVGDKVFLYTDAVIEWQNPDKEQFGVERLKSSLFKYRHLESKEIISFLIDDIKGFSKGTPRWDDLTIMMFEYTGK